MFGYRLLKHNVKAITNIGRQFEDNRADPDGTCV